MRSEQDFKALVDRGYYHNRATRIGCVSDNQCRTNISDSEGALQKSEIFDKPVRRSLVVLEKYGYIGNIETKQAQGCSLA